VTLAQEESAFMTLCKTCGFEFLAPASCPECGTAFHF
jgi:rubrerythrin